MNSEVYYFNNAATTWPKPDRVVSAVKDYFNDPPINSSRHCNCVKNNEDVDLVCKRKIAEFFNVDTEKYDITITGGATYSANIVIYWLSKTFSNLTLITDNCCHNSIYRTHFEKIGTKPIIVANVSHIWYQVWENKDIETYAAISHVNNVDGTKISESTLQEIFCKLKEPKNIPVILDITQSAGTYDIDISKYDYDNLYVICSGHKGLFSTTGIGFLISPKGKIKIPFVSGGTGGAQGIDYQHTGSLEAGTPNELAMTSLIAGIDFLKDTSLGLIRITKEMFVDYFLEKLPEIKTDFLKYFKLVDVKDKSSGIICFKILNKEKCLDFITKMNKAGIIIRSGVHCAPLYHINVLNCEGTLRISFGYFNTKTQIDYLFDFINSTII